MATKSNAREQRFKDQAERLRDFLAAAGVELKHTTSLQALAHMHKAQDWRALLASSIEPEMASIPVATKFIELNVTSDSADSNVTEHKVSVRVDQIAGFADVDPKTSGSPRFFGNPKTRVHLTEPNDWEVDPEVDDDGNETGGGVVRAYRQLYVRESFDEIRTLIGG